MEQREIYMDHAATSYMTDEVLDVVTKAMRDTYGNPSSRHRLGAETTAILKDCREKIAKTIGAEEKEIVFTSGGTESNNMALKGAAYAHQRTGKHIISTKIEHGSVAQPLIYLESQGFEVTWLDVDRAGHVDPEAVAAAIRPDTILVSVMAVNNEMGAIEPLEAIGKAIKKANPKTLFHVDAVQAYGKMKLSVNRCKIDMMSVSAHKFHGPKGVGFLYLRDKTRIITLIHGGGQQKDMRSGTENVPAIMGMTEAAVWADANMTSRMEHIAEIKEAFLAETLKIEGVKSHSGEAPHIVSLSFDGITRAETLLHALELRGIYCSSGSACSSNHPGISGTMKAIGLEDEEIQGILRFSFAESNTLEEVKIAADAIRKEVAILREFRQR